MADTRVRIDLNESKIRREFGRSFDDAQRVLDLQVLQDTEPYVPYAQGELTRSGIRASDIGSGELVYDTPYARKQYYTSPNKARDVHPQATMQWFEVAKRAFKERWIRVAKRAGGKR